MSAGAGPPLAGPFEDLAEVYDRFRIGYARELFDALEEYGAPRDGHAFDLGCGTGLVAAELAARGARVTGLDRSPAMIERARKRLPDAELVIGHAEALPFKDDSFDVAVSAQAFHWFDQPRALDELARVVRPGGTVAVWWKGLMRGDNMRAMREDIAREIGLSPPPDLLTANFEAFDRCALLDRRLRIIPWQVTLTVDNFLGYERSRARSRDAYGDRLGEYMERLSQRLAGGATEISLFYTHLLYLGRAPEAGS